MVGTSSGTTLKIGTNTIAHLSSIGGVSLSAETIDVTALDTTDGYRKHIASFKDGGEVPVSGFFDFEDEGQQALYTAFNAETTDSYTIEFPAAIGAKWTFSAVVSNFETSAEVGNAVSFSATLKISGKPVLSATTSQGG